MVSLHFKKGLDLRQAGMPLFPIPQNGWCTDRVVSVYSIFLDTQTGIKAYIWLQSRVFIAF